MKSNKIFIMGLFLMVSLFMITGCKKDPENEVLSSFVFKVDSTNFLKVNFTNASQNFTSLSWDFGDGQASTDANPSHTYAKIGDYTVRLVATGASGTHESSQKITIADTNGELTKLAGTTSKTWKLLGVANNGRYPLEVGPFDRSSVWWAMGRENGEIQNRLCSMNDEFTFQRDGVYKLDDKGDFWVEGGWYAKPDNICAASTAANMKDGNGNDMSKFGSGTHKFTLSPNKLTLTGLGAWIGLFKLGTDLENKLPVGSTTYNIKKLTDGAVDTLILENDYKFNASDANFGGYWRIVLVHYDNPSDEPKIPPYADFTSSSILLDATFTNKSLLGATYSWDFGDGKTSTAENPTHKYDVSGEYTVKLTATSGNGSSTTSKKITVTDGSFTLNNLVGKAWKVRKENKSVFVGPALGSPDWWSCPLENLDGTKIGTTDDWSCMLDDEFIFTADGTYQYKTNGSARNDSYMGSPNGCWTDAEIEASGNGAAFGSAKHKFTLTPGTSSSRAIIELTNGDAGRAAFIGFYKGYYGGENGDKTKAPNGGSTTNRYEVISYVTGGGKETLTLSVDISADKKGGAAWSVVLVR
jgi:PKD repeat protein